MRRVFRSACALGVAAVALALPPAAAAQNPPLTMEVLNGDSTTSASSVEITCTAFGSGTLEYSVGGLALGPYPGTFFETGTVALTDGFVTGFEASFTITSGDTTIEGTKSLAPGVVATGRCEDVSAEFPPGPQLFFFTPGFSGVYTATITSPSETSQDSGTVETTHNAMQGLITAIGTQEVFVSSGPTTVELSPLTSVNPVNTSHTVTATVRTVNGGPAANVEVLFAVTGSVDTSGSCTTDASGECSFTYDGPSLPGTDAITGCADSNRNGSSDPGEPCGAASKVWALAPSTHGHVTGGGYIDNPTTGRLSFGFSAKSSAGDVKGNCNLIDHAIGVHVKCRSVDGLVVTGTHATFFGEATVDGVATNYTIDVDDLGEPGAGSDTFRIETDSGYVAAGVLSGGNIQIHS
jgi:hypothetical protein